MTSNALAEALAMSAAELRPLLRQLVADGLVEQTGRGRGTRYRLPEGGDA